MDKSQYTTEDMADMNEEEVWQLYLRRFPRMDSKLARTAKKLKALMEEVREVFPDATYYTAGGGFHLVVGKTHCDKGRMTNDHLCVWGDTSGLSICDGDW